MVPETEAEARHELLDTDAAYGWVPPDMLPAAAKLRWLQNPQAGPAPGYDYPALIAHPVVVCNPRGIYFDHISHHILMFVLALSRGLPDYLAAQRQRRWDPQARQHPYLYLGEATALIVGVGGIGHETARLCTALGMTVLGVDPLGSGHLCVRLRLAGPSRAQTWQKQRPPDTPIAEPASHANHSQGHQTTVDHTRTN